MRSSIFSNAVSPFASSLTQPYWVKHVTASASSREKNAVTARCFVKNVPPASGGIIPAVCRLLQSCSNMNRMTCFLWQVTHNITIHTISLSLEESCLKINANDVSNFCCLPFGNSSESRVLWKQENPSVEILSVCLGNLLIPIWRLPWGSYFVCPPWWWAPIFRSHHLSAWLSSGRRDQEPRCQTRICTLGILPQQTVCSVLVLLELRLILIHGISF